MILQTTYLITCFLSPYFDYIIKSTIRDGGITTLHTAYTISTVSILRYTTLYCFNSSMYA